MAIAANPVPIPNAVNTDQGTLSGANTARDGSGSNLVTVFTAGANGAILRAIHFHAMDTVAAAVMTIFLKRSSTYTLIGEVLVDATTADNTNVAWSSTWFPDDPKGYPLEASDAIVVGQTIAHGVAVTAFGGDF